VGTLTKPGLDLLGDYESIPKPIQAVQLTDENAAVVARMVNGRVYTPDKTNPNVRVYFFCCNSRVKAEWGDWLIRLGRGFITMTNEEFTETYKEKL
jgi:hypothetical protein